MDSRQRVRNALTHSGGEIPVDFGSSAVTGIHVRAIENLRRYYGLERRPVQVIDPYQMLGRVDDDLASIMGCDIAGHYPRNTMFGFPNEGFKMWKTPWRQEVLVPEKFLTSHAPAGGVYIYPEGRRTAPPSGLMPEGGYFFDTIIRQPPVDDDRLDPAENCEEFTELTGDDLDYIDRSVAALEKTGKAILANFGGTGFGDIALVTAPFLAFPRGIRDVTEWYISTVSRQDYIHAVFSRQCEIALRNLEKIHDRIADRIDVIFVCGTDLGTQTSTFCSLDTFRGLYAPYYRKINDWIHAHTGWKTFKHSCGAVEPFIGAFIESGFDILNPVQCSAAGMDPVALKRKYGNRLVFWGGGVDTQKTLPFGTPDEVRREVFSRCEILGRDGGFVFTTVHNIQADTPVDNLAAMVEALRELRTVDGNRGGVDGNRG